MRIALVYRNFNLSGSLERDEVFLARGLIELGHDVHCYGNPKTSTTEIPGATFHDVRPWIVSTSRLGLPLERASFALGATRALRQDRGSYDVIDVCGVSAWEHDVVTVHGVTSAGTRTWWRDVGANRRLRRTRKRLGPILRPDIAVGRAIEKLQFRTGRYKRVLVPTEQVKLDVITEHGVPDEMIDVVPYPVDVAVFARAPRDGLRKELGIDADALVLLFIGNDPERKGLGETIEAVASLQPRPHLVVVGKPAAMTSFRSKAGLEGNIHFVGATEHPERYYANADVLVLPTKYDPWCIPLIEGMAAGIPVVTTTRAGSAPVVEAANAGIVLQEPSVRGLREALDALARDPVRRSEMGARGANAADRFSIASHAAATAAAYERARDA